MARVAKWVARRGGLHKRALTVLIVLKCCTLLILLVPGVQIETGTRGVRATRPDAAGFDAAGPGATRPTAIILVRLGDGVDGLPGANSLQDFVSTRGKQSPQD